MKRRLSFFEEIGSKRLPPIEENSSSDDDEKITIHYKQLMQQGIQSSVNVDPDYEVKYLKGLFRLGMQVQHWSMVTIGGRRVGGLCEHKSLRSCGAKQDTIFTAMSLFGPSKVLASHIGELELITKDRDPIRVPMEYDGSSCLCLDCKNVKSREHFSVDGSTSFQMDSKRGGQFEIKFANTSPFFSKFSTVKSLLIPHHCPKQLENVLSMIPDAVINVIHSYNFMSPDIKFDYNSVREVSISPECCDSSGKNTTIRFASPNKPGLYTIWLCVDELNPIFLTIRVS